MQKVLAPQVYIASHDQDLTGAGAVISAPDVKVASTGNLKNTGSIFARNTVQLVVDNINNLGGRIHADSVLATAKTDINNIAGTILAGHELIAVAGRDINVETTTRSASCQGSCIARPSPRSNQFETALYFWKVTICLPG